MTTLSVLDENFNIIDLDIRDAQVGNVCALLR